MIVATSIGTGTTVVEDEVTSNSHDETVHGSDPTIGLKQRHTAVSHQDEGSRYSDNVKVKLSSISTSSSSSSGTETSEQFEAMISKPAYPPGHSILFTASVTLLACTMVPSLESIDKVATTSTFCEPLFPSMIPSTTALAYVRLAIAAFIFTITATVWLGPGLNEYSAYLSQSKLRRAKLILKGWRSQAMFTSWIWNFLGFSFLLNGLIPLLVVSQQSESTGQLSLWANAVTPQQLQWLLRLAVINFEVAAPMTMLVSAIIKYVLWPAAEARCKEDAEHLKKPLTLIQHNLNIILALAEVGLLGGVPVRLSDLAVSILLGASYVIFSWCMQRSWVIDDTDDMKGDDDTKISTQHPQKRNDPQFIYFILDTTLGATTTYFLMGLLGVLLASYTIFSSLQHIFTVVGGTGDHLITHFVVVGLLSSLVCRFR